MRCPECGAEVRGDAVACPSCGANLVVDASAKAEAAEPRVDVGGETVAMPAVAMPAQPAIGIEYDSNASGASAEAGAAVGAAVAAEAAEGPNGRTDPAPAASDDAGAAPASALPNDAFDAPVSVPPAAPDDTASQALPLIDANQGVRANALVSAVEESAYEQERPRVRKRPQAPFDPSDPASLASPEPAYRVRHIKEPKAPSAFRKVIVTLAAIALLGGVIAGGATIIQQQSQNVAQAQNASVPVSILADGIGVDGSSKTPVQVEGTAADGSTFKKVFYISGDSGKVSMPQGSFAFSVPASPIAADGTVYDVSAAKIETTVNQGGPAAPIALKLSPIDPLNVTDDVVSKAYTYADNGGTESGELAYSLKAAALKRRDQAVAQKNAADAAAAKQAEDEAKRHIIAASYEFYLPEEWVDKVKATVSGDTVTIAPNDYPNEPLLTLTAAATQPDAYTDQDYSFWFQGPALANGQFVWGHGMHWGFQIASYNVQNDPDPSHHYSFEEAEELVNLQSGGKLTYDQVLQQMQNGGYSDQMAEEVHAFIRDGIASTIKPRS